MKVVRFEVLTGCKLDACGTCTPDSTLGAHYHEGCRTSYDDAPPGTNDGSTHQHRPLRDRVAGEHELLAHAASEKDTSVPVCKSARFYVLPHHETLATLDTSTDCSKVPLVSQLLLNSSISPASALPPSSYVSVFPSRRDSASSPLTKPSRPSPPRYPDPSLTSAFRTFNPSFPLSYL